MQHTARWLWLLFWLSLLGLLTFYFYERTQPSVTADGQLLLKADQSGHYRLTGAINGVAVQLMLDTGASRITIPQNIAEQLGLSSRTYSQVNTAAGPITVGNDQIDNLQMGPITLHKLAVFINPAMDGSEILVGMNALSRLEIRQKDRQLMLQPINK